MPTKTNFFMASRREVMEKRLRLQQELRAACAGAQEEGAMLPSQAELGQRHGLSAAVVHQELRALIVEGLAHAIPRVGTFVGRPQSQEFQAFLLVLPHFLVASDFRVHLKSGYEEQIAARGGATLCLTETEVWEHRKNGDLPPLCGVFEINSPALRQAFVAEGVPCVSFSNGRLPPTEVDSVRFDDEDGGHQATAHLLGFGHERIAFLALHAQDDESGIFAWSQQRQTGWQAALEKAGFSARGLAFHPARTSGVEHQAQIEAGAHASAELLRQSDITAIVATNHLAAAGLFQQLRQGGRPASQWPAILCFDEEIASNSSVVSYLRLPWEETGRAAAELLWERASGQLQGPPQHRATKMRLIPRLTCRPDRAQTTRAFYERAARTSLAALAPT